MTYIVDNLAFILDGHYMHIVALVQVSIMMSSYLKFSTDIPWEMLVSTHAKFTKIIMEINYNVGTDIG